MRSRSLGIVLIVVGALGLGASWAGSAVMGSWGPGPGGMGLGWMRSMHDGMMGRAPGSQSAPTPVPGAREVRVVAGEFSFTPTEIIAEAGGTTNVVLANEGATLHDLTIPALGFRLVARPGATASGALSAPRAGRYGFFCSVPGHADAGMQGVLVVT